jgi:hypothetical protein
MVMKKNENPITTVLNEELKTLEENISRLNSLKMNENVKKLLETFQDIKMFLKNEKVEVYRKLHMVQNLPLLYLQIKRVGEC